MTSIDYDGAHSISFINQDWKKYPDFQHVVEPPIPKERYIGHKHRDGTAHDDRNTWEDWHLIPTSRPVVAPPPFNKNKVTVKGASGDVDLTYATAPWPTFGVRTGSWEFIVQNGVKPWTMLQNEIGAFLHGRDVRVILQDDPTYYYEGLCDIGSWNSNNDGTWSTITINYELQPYKKSIFNSIEEWEWNPFNFKYGTVHNFGGIFNNIKPYRDINQLYLDSNGWLYSDNRAKLKDIASWGKKDPDFAGRFASSETISLDSKIGSMPVYPRFRINWPNAPYEYEFALAVRYYNPAITSERYKAFRLKPGKPSEPCSDIIFYDSFKRRSNEIQFLLAVGGENTRESIIKNYNESNAITVSVIFTPGEVL